MLGGSTGRDEIRQCVLIHIAVALLWTSRKRVPSIKAVLDLASKLRLSITELAWEAMEALGDVYPVISATGRDCREFLHDNLNLDHDRDFRGLALLQL